MIIEQNIRYGGTGVSIHFVQRGERQPTAMYFHYHHQDNVKAITNIIHIWSYFDGRK